MDQLAAFRHALHSIFGTRLKGIYLHGSMAMGCFNPSSSDIDLLVLLHDRAPIDALRDLAESTLTISRNPSPLEFSILHAAQLVPWRHPTPYDYHYSEDWRFRTTEDLLSGDWKHWYGHPLFDPDLAAHITMLHHRGICLDGEPTSPAFPPVPPGHFEMALAVDLAWARRQIDRNPLYAVLNHCRAWAFFHDGLFLSKREGIAWAFPRVHPDHRATLARAGSLYGEGIAASFPVEPARACCEYICAEIGSPVERME